MQSRSASQRRRREEGLGGGKHWEPKSRKRDVTTTGRPLSRQCPFNPGIILDSRDCDGECVSSAAIDSDESTRQEFASRKAHPDAVAVDTFDARGLRTPDTQSLPQRGDSLDYGICVALRIDLATRDRSHGGTVE